jgi:hypothetical protein
MTGLKKMAWFETKTSIPRNNINYKLACMV